MHASCSSEIPQPRFEIHERDDPDGALRLTLVGELDKAVVHHLAARLEPLCQARRWARIDLSQLAFIDPCGAEEILATLIEARRIGWKLEVAFVTDASER